MLFLLEDLSYTHFVKLTFYKPHGPINFWIKKRFIPTLGKISQGMLIVKEFR